MTIPDLPARQAVERDQHRLILLIAVLTAATVFGARPLASYKAIELGASNLEIGVIASAFALLALAAAIPVGRAVDRRGERRVILFGLVLLAVGACLIVATPSTAFLVVSQSAMGLGQLMVVVGSHTFLATRGSPDRRDDRIGAYASAASLGQFVGPVAAEFVAQAVFGPGVTVVFAAVAISFVVTMALAVRLPGPTAATETEEDPPDPASVLAVMAEPTIRRALIASSALLVGLDMMLAYLPVFGVERGYEPFFVGLMLGCLGLSQLVSRLFIGSIVRRVGHGGMLLIALGIPAVLLPILTLVDIRVVLIGLMVVFGLALGLGQPTTIAMIAGAAAAGTHGLAMSLRMAGNRLGQLTVPAVVGGTAGHAGTTAIFWSTAGILAVACIYLSRGSYAHFRRQVRSW